MPSDVSARVGFFDRFAGWAAAFASRAPFFAFCVLLVIGWIIQGLLTVAFTGDLSRLMNDKYQLEINTTTTIITFLLVALLQNSQTREDQATQHKLNAMADAMADMMEQMAQHWDVDSLRDDIHELRLAVGLEERESTGEHRAEPTAS
jgi:low affinity Fe/Cu permease